MGRLCIGLLTSLLFLTLSSAQQEGASTLVVPSTNLTSTEVVRIQIEALQHNNYPYTGPVNRFAHITKASYNGMLYHVRAEFGEAEILGNEARLGVILPTTEGIQHGFMFVLSKQLRGEYSGMWMTDTVLRFNVAQPSGT